MLSLNKTPIATTEAPIAVNIDINVSLLKFRPIDIKSNINTVLTENLVTEFKNEIVLSSETDFLKIITIALQSLFTSHHPNIKTVNPKENCPIQLKKHDLLDSKKILTFSIISPPYKKLYHIS